MGKSTVSWNPRGHYNEHIAGGRAEEGEEAKEGEAEAHQGSIGSRRSASRTLTSESSLASADS